MTTNAAPGEDWLDVPVVSQGCLFRNNWESCQSHDCQGSPRTHELTILRTVCVALQVRNPAKWISAVSIRFTVATSHVVQCIAFGPAAQGCVATSVRPRADNVKES